MNHGSGHECEFPQGTPGDQWVCSFCQRHYVAVSAGPLDIAWVDVKSVAMKNVDTSVI